MLLAVSCNSTLCFEVILILWGIRTKCNLIQHHMVSVLHNHLEWSWLFAHDMMEKWMITERSVTMGQMLTDSVRHSHWHIRGHRNAYSYLTDYHCWKLYWIVWCVIGLLDPSIYHLFSSPGLNTIWKWKDMFILILWSLHLQ